jgi:hypothetical protein
VDCGVTLHVDEPLAPFADASPLPMRVRTSLPGLCAAPLSFESDSALTGPVEVVPAPGGDVDVYLTLPSSPPSSTIRLFSNPNVNPRDAWSDVNTVVHCVPAATVDSTGGVRTDALDASSVGPLGAACTATSATSAIEAVNQPARLASGSGAFFLHVAYLGPACTSDFRGVASRRNLLDATGDWLLDVNGCVPELFSNTDEVDARMGIAPGRWADIGIAIASKTVTFVVDGVEAGDADYHSFDCGPSCPTPGERSIDGIFPTSADAPVHIGADVTASEDRVLGTAVDEIFIDNAPRSGAFLRALHQGLFGMLLVEERPLHPAPECGPSPGYACTGDVTVGSGRLDYTGTSGAQAVGPSVAPPAGGQVVARFTIARAPGVTTTVGLAVASDPTTGIFVHVSGDAVGVDRVAGATTTENATLQGASDPLGIAIVADALGYRVLFSSPVQRCDVSSCAQLRGDRPWPADVALAPSWSAQGTATSGTASLVDLSLTRAR